MTVRALPLRQQPCLIREDDPLLHTRLFVPPARPDLVERPDLLARVGQGVQRRLLLITAPAGSGKTTLLSAWRATEAGRDWPLAWVSLTAGENEPLRFWRYVIAALDLVAPGIGAEALTLLRPPEQATPERVLTELINALSGRADVFVLVLDDYHVIRNPAIHEALGFLIAHMPAQMHVVIAGQEEPPLPLARLRGRGQLAELHAADLRFSAAEARAFLNGAMGLHLADSDVLLLEERTEGWIAGLQLVALALQMHGGVGDLSASFMDGHRFIVEYLAAEVLQRQPVAVQDFLLKTAILDRFTAALCDAVTGAANGTAMLERLEQANLFLVPLDAAGHWYRYHHLFGDFLRTYPRRTGGAEAGDLHGRAARWYEGAGMVDEAISHYASAGDMARAAELIERHARGLFMRSEVARVHTWLAALPADLVRARPRLGIARAWALAHDYRVEEAEQCLRDVARALAAPASSPALAEADRIGMEGEMAAIHARLAGYHGEIDTVIAIARQALRLLPAHYSFSRSEISLSLAFAYRDQEDLEAAEEALGETIAMCQATGNTRGVMYAVRTLGSLYELRGQLRRAAALYNQHLPPDDPAAGAPSPARGFGHAALSAVLLEWNDLDGAFDQALRAVALSKQGGDGKILLLGYTSLALAQQAHGETEAALETAARLTRLSPNLYHMAVQTEIWLAQGNVEAAAAWARASGLDPAEAPRFAVEHESLILARALYAEGRVEAAITLLERLLAGAVAGGREGKALHIRVWLALAQQALGDTDEALATLAPGLALAEREGYIRSFAAGGPAMVALLRHALHAAPAGGRARDYTPGGVERLLAVLAAPAPLPQPDDGPAAPGKGRSAGLVEPLSEREIAVLRLLGAGLSNEQIAQELVITIGTVKTHLRNAYGKLDVHSRTQALAKARALQLV
jgi:LuxR family maltose regulon positive regulatory protein